MGRVTLSIPPTLNASYRARSDGRGQYKTTEAKLWQREVMYRMGQFRPLTGDIVLTIDLYYKFNRDIDASLKLALDALQGYAYTDDEQITQLILTKQKDSKNPRLEITWESKTP